MAGVGLLAVVEDLGVEFRTESEPEPARPTDPLTQEDPRAERLHEVLIERVVRQRGATAIEAPLPVALVEFRPVDPGVAIEVTLLDDEAADRVERLAVAPACRDDR